VDGTRKPVSGEAMVRTSTRLFVGIFVALRSASALGQTAAPSAAAESSAEAADSQALASKAFDEAAASYERGDVAGALGLMERAYELSHRPELLFNLGELQRELGRCPAALHSYQQYLAQAAEGKMRGEAEHELSLLEPVCGAEVAAPTQPVVLQVSPRAEAPAAPVVQLQPSATPYWTPSRKVGWAALGAAALAGAGAAYLAIEAADAERTTERRVAQIQAGGTTAPGYGDADRSREAAGQRDAHWAQVLSVGAVGLAAAGIILLVVDSPHAENRAASVSLGCAPGSLSAAYSRSF